MERTVNRKIIDAWVSKHKPDGVSKLAEKSNVSTSMISKVRCGRVPVKALTRKALAKALSTSETALFPVMTEKTTG